MNLRSEIGSVFILVLILLTAISFLSIHVLKQGLLTAKLSVRFQAQLQAWVAAENQLQQEETRIKKDPSRHLKNKIAFVPDDLQFGCQEGVDIFKVRMPPVESFIAVRKTQTIKKPLYQRLVPTGEWDSSAAWVDVVWCGIPAVQCGLWDAGAGSKGILYLLDSETGKELSRFELPFSIARGALSLANAYYSNTEHTILVLTAKNRNGEESVVLIFEVHAAARSLQLLNTYSNDAFLIGKGRAAIIRLQDGRFGVAVAGKQARQGVLKIFLLDAEKTVLQFPISEHGLHFVMAMDVAQQGFVDRIYLTDDRHLLAVNIQHTTVTSVEKLASVEITAPPLAVPDVNGQGVQVYFLGHALKTQGLFVLHDPLGAKPLSSEIRLIDTGEFGAFFIQFGRLWLIVRDLTVNPRIIDLPSYQPIPAIWRVLSSAELSSLSQSALLTTRIWWDAAQEKEVLLSLNLGGQLSILTPSFKKNKYDRVLWRAKW